MRRDCPRSAEVAAAVAGGSGASLCACAPDGGDSELHQHVAGCPACADLALVMSSLRSERERSRREAVVPSAGLVWWRAQLRQRQAAARTAAAPVTVLHALTLSLAVVFAVFLVWTLARTAGMPGVALGLPALPAWAAAVSSEATTAPSLVRYGVILGATAWLILGPVALYFALRRD
jgi:hypothetical protein